MEKRVKKNKGRKHHTIMLQLNPELYNKLKKESEKLHTPVSTLIRLWIAERLLEKEGK